MKKKITLVTILILAGAWALLNIFTGMPQTVDASASNAYRIDFKKDWNSLQEQLGINPAQCKIGNFELQFKEDGTISEMSYYLIRESPGPGFTHYRVYMSSTRQGIYKIKKTSVGDWVQFYRLVPAGKFFEIVDRLDFSKMLPAGDYAWYCVWYSGEITNSISEHQNFQINGNSIKKITGTGLPVKGYCISVCGMHKNYSTEDVTEYEGKGYRDYFFTPGIG